MVNTSNSNRIVVPSGGRYVGTGSGGGAGGTYVGSTGEIISAGRGSTVGREYSGSGYHAGYEEGTYRNRPTTEGATKSQSQIALEESSKEKQLKRDIDLRQREIAQRKIGTITRIETSTTGEKTYIGFSGKKYTFPSETEFTYTGRQKFGGTPSQEQSFIPTPKELYFEETSQQRTLLLSAIAPTAGTGGFAKLAQQRYIEEREKLMYREMTKASFAGGNIQVAGEVSPTFVTFGRIPEIGAYKKRLADLTVEEERQYGSMVFSAALPSAIKYSQMGLGTGKPEEYSKYLPKQISLNERIYKAGEKAYAEMLKPYNAIANSKSIVGQYMAAVGVVAGTQRLKETLPLANYLISGKEKIDYQKFITSGKTLYGAALVPFNILGNTYTELQKTPFWKYMRTSLPVMGYQYGKLQIEKAFLMLPSSEKLSTYFIEQSKKDIEFYDRLIPTTTKGLLGESKEQRMINKGIAQFNIIATNVLFGAYEEVRTKPVESAYTFGTGFLFGAGLGKLAQFKTLEKATKIFGLGMAATYTGQVAAQTYLLPLEQKGTFLGKEFVSSSLFIAGFGKGYSEFFTPPLSRQLIEKGGLTYEGKTYYKYEPKSERYGIITSQYEKITPVERIGRMKGRISKRATVEGVFREDVLRKVVYEVRNIDYEGVFFRNEYLVNEKIDLARMKSYIDVFEANKDTYKAIASYKGKFIPQSYSPLTRGFEKEQTRQITSFTPERSYDLYLDKNGNIRTRIIQTGRKDSLLRKLHIEQQRLSGQMEINPYAVSTEYTEVGITLKARQTRPQKNILSVVQFSDEVDKLRYLAKEASGFEPFTKVKIAETSQFRELYLGMEKFESRKPQYARNLYPSDVLLNLEKQPELIKNPLLSRTSILKQFKITAEPSKYFGLEEQFTPALVTKQQKVIISQEFKFRIPRAAERQYITELVSKEYNRRQKEQNLFEQFMTGKYTTKEMLNEIYPQLGGVKTKGGKYLTPNYLNKLNEKFRVRVIKSNEKLFKRGQVLEQQKQIKSANEIKSAKALNVNINYQKGLQSIKGVSNLIKGISQTRVLESIKVPIMTPLARLETRNVTKENLKQSNRLMSNLSVNLKSNLEINLRNQLRSNLESNLRNQLRSNLETNLKSQLKTEAQLQTIIDVNINIPTTPNIPRPIIPPRIPTPTIIIIEGEFFETKKKKLKKFKATKFKYLPSLEAVSKRIYGHKPKLMTGLEIRRIAF